MIATQFSHSSRRAVRQAEKTKQRRLSISKFSSFPTFLHSLFQQLHSWYSVVFFFFFYRLCILFTVHWLMLLQCVHFHFVEQLLAPENYERPTFSPSEIVLSKIQATAMVYNTKHCLNTKYANWKWKVRPLCSDQLLLIIINIRWTPNWKWNKMSLLPANFWGYVLNFPLQVIKIANNYE